MTSKRLEVNNFEGWLCSGTFTSSRCWDTLKHRIEGFEELLGQQGKEHRLPNICSRSSKPTNPVTATQTTTENTSWEKSWDIWMRLF